MIGNIAAILLFFIFCGLIGFRSFQLKRQGIRISESHPDTQKIITGTFTGLFFLAFTAEMFTNSFHFNFSIFPEMLSRQLFSHPFTNMCGLFFMLLALCFMHLALKSMKSSLRFGLNANNRGKLVTGGIFAHTRNPFFISIELLFIGLALVFATYFFIGTAILTIPAVHLFVLREEKYMRKHYGQEYLDYCKKVRRYF